MDKYDIRRMVSDAADRILARSWILGRDTVRLVNAMKQLYQTDDSACETLLAAFNSQGEYDMAKAKKAEYLETCPDCWPLPTAFPQSCLGPIMAALGGTIDDPKCLLHCSITLAAWGAGLYIGDDHPHPLIGDKVATAAPDNAAALAELKKVQAACEPKKGKGAEKLEAADFAAFNWKLVLASILALIQQLLSQQGQ